MVKSSLGVSGGGSEGWDEALNCAEERYSPLTLTLHPRFLLHAARHYQHCTPHSDAVLGGAISHLHMREQRVTNQ